MLGRRLIVNEVRRGGNSIFQTAFLNAADARALFGIDKLVNFFLLDLRTGARVSAVSTTARRLLPGTETRASNQFSASFAGRVQPVSPWSVFWSESASVVGGAVVHFDDVHRDCGTCA